MGKIEEYIAIIGADKAEQELARLAGAQANLGDETEQTGRKGKDAAGGFGDLGGALDKAAGSAKTFIAGFAGFETIRRFVGEYLNLLREIDELQKKMSAQTVSFAGQAKIFAQQVGLTEKQAMKVLSDLMIAGGFDVKTASDMGVGAHIAFGDQGGLMAGVNLETTKRLAAFAGAKGFSQEEAASLFGLLKTAGALRSPEAAMEATAKIAAAADASRAASIGKFVKMVEQGATAMFKEGVPLQDILTIAGQARQVQPSLGGEAPAAQTMLTLIELAGGAEKPFTAEIERQAGLRGLDPRTLTMAQRIQISRDIFAGITTSAEADRIRGLISPERARRVITAFRASTVAEAAPVAEAGLAATAADVQATIEQARSTVAYRAAAGEAQRQYRESMKGFEFFFRDELQKRAQERLDADKVRPVPAFGEDPTASIVGMLGRLGHVLATDEAEREQLMYQELVRIYRGLKTAGIDKAEVDELGRALGTIGGRTRWPIVGYDDDVLLRAAQVFERVLEKHPRVAYHINTQYMDTEAGRLSEAAVNLND